MRDAGASSVHASAGASSVHASAGASSVHASAGASSVHASAGASSVHASAGASSVHASAESLLKARPQTKPVKSPASNEAALHAKQILNGIGSGITKLGSSLDGEAPKWSSVGVSTVVLGLLAIPIVVLTTVTLIVRAKKRGSIHMRSSRNGSAGGFGLSNGTSGNWRTEGNGLHQLGSSLLNKHRGFRQLATEDIDEPSSGDSDIEEFSQVTAKA
ncbi:hypothetical protein FHG87_018798 [Trinorchestia longiramus]|nr:hypothetical protein FHG87_018798 [Trinorchestia longiramus]